MISIPDPLELRKAAGKGRLSWIDPSSEGVTTVEGAVASWLRMQGFHVPYGSAKRARNTYQPILDACILATMFDNFDPKNADHRRIYEDVFHGGLRTNEKKDPTFVARQSFAMKLMLDIGGNDHQVEVHEKALAGALSRSHDQIFDNLKKILTKYLKKSGVSLDVLGEGLNPNLLAERTMEIFESLGVEKLISLQRYYAVKSGEVNQRGWPDLLAWNKEHFAFFEVKGPRDRISSDQNDVIENIRRLEINCNVLNVTHR